LISQIFVYSVDWFGFHSTGIWFKVTHYCPCGCCGYDCRDCFGTRNFCHKSHRKSSPPLSCDPSSWDKSPGSWKIFYIFFYMVQPGADTGGGAMGAIAPPLPQIGLPQANHRAKLENTYRKKSNLGHQSNLGQNFSFFSITQWLIHIFRQNIFKLWKYSERILFWIMFSNLQGKIFLGPKC